MALKTSLNNILRETITFKVNFLRETQILELINKQVRTNIGLDDTLILSSFLYLIYMGGTGRCDSIKIIFGYDVNS